MSGWKDVGVTQGFGSYTKHKQFLCCIPLLTCGSVSGPGFWVRISQLASSRVFWSLLPEVGLSRYKCTSPQSLPRSMTTCLHPVSLASLRWWPLCFVRLAWLWCTERRPTINIETLRREICCHMSTIFIPLNIMTLPCHISLLISLNVRKNTDNTNNCLSIKGSPVLNGVKLNSTGWDSEEAATSWGY